MLHKKQIKRKQVQKDNDKLEWTLKVYQPFISKYPNVNNEIM